jgi:hypothetical protein
MAQRPRDRAVAFESRLVESTVNKYNGSFCVEWTGGQSRGYGSFVRNNRARGAHVVAYEKVYGPVPRGQCVCHRCDNPLCCNPKHLFLGTRKDNNKDRDIKGRQWKKLDGHQVAKVRSLIGSGPSQREIAAMFGVAESTISLIKSGARRA